MPRKKLQKNRRPDVLRRQTWDKAKMAEAIKKVRNKEMSFLKASKVFEVPKTTLRRLALQVEKLPEVVVEQKMGRKPVFTDQMENELVELLLEKESICLGFTNQDVRKLAFQLAERNKIPHPFHNEAAGRVWLDNFLARHKEKLLIGTPTETACAQGEEFSSEQVAPLFNVLEAEYVKHSLQPDKILNADETVLGGVPSKVSQVASLKEKQPTTTSKPTTENEFRVADIKSLNVTDANLIPTDHLSVLPNFASTSSSISTDRQTPKSDLTSQEMSIMSASPSTPAISAPSTSEIITCRLFLPVPSSKKKTYTRCHKQSSAAINSASSLKKYLVEPKKHASQRQGCGKNQERWRYGTRGMKKKEPQPEPSDLPSDAADLTFNLTVKEDSPHPSGRTIFKCLQR